MGSSRAAQLSLSVAALVWVSLVVFLPGGVFPIGHFICHQRPERSFFFHGHQLAVCARCTGLYAGAAAAGPLALLAIPLTAAGNRWLLGLAAIPTLVTWTLEFAGVMPFSNVARFVAAIPLGAAAAWLVLSQFAHPPSTIDHRSSNSRHRPSPIGHRSSDTGVR
jgi:uncharacterized membrane protein